MEENELIAHITESKLNLETICKIKIFPVNCSPVLRARGLEAAPHR